MKKPLQQPLVNNYGRTNLLIKFRKTVFFILALFAMSFLFRANDVKGQTLPTGFSQVLVANGISNPTVMAFAPDGRIFVAQQTGQLRIIKNGTLLTQPFMNLPVNASGERGLLGIAFDPNFNSNNYIYLYYTLSSGENNRISRFTANGDVVVAGSEMVVLDLDPLSGATNHNGGTMQFGPDGKLYIGVGENANPANAQLTDTYHGKILRINSDGSVPADNPFTTGSNQQLRLWSYGLRNPFTIAFQPGTGRLFVNDVGSTEREEINDATSAGKNFGWPQVEGISNSSYDDPVYAYPHESGIGSGCAITGGDFFNPSSTNYPSSYFGKYFFLDYCNNWIDMLTLNGGPATRSNFASSIAGSPVSLVTGTDGNLYFLSRDNNAVYKITFTGSSTPVITNQPQNIKLAQGNSAVFNVTATGAGPLSYQWRKNGSNISGATSSAFTISSLTSANAGIYSVVVSNASGSIISSNAILQVLPANPANQAPTATITAPSPGATYAGGNVIHFSGTATDPENGILSESAYSWYVLFFHDTHSHPGPTAASGATSGSFTIPDIGETASNVFYRLYLVVTDQQGARDTAYSDILPRTSTITLNTIPEGLIITLDGQPFTAPLTVTSVEGVLRTIGTPSPQTINGLTYAFSNWSHGGAQTQTFATPANNVVYTASFNENDSLRNADNPSNTAPGLDYYYYHGTWNELPDFATLYKEGAGNVLNFDLSPRTANNDFGFRFTGYISVPADGIYTFYTSSDEGSKLYIGTMLVVDNDSLHANQERSGQIGLKAGKHQVTVDFFEKSAEEILTVSYEGAGIPKQVIPDSVLFRATPAQVVLNPVADAYVRSGIYNNINIEGGASTSLSIGNSTETGNGTENYETFLRFDISSLSAGLSSAKLRLYDGLNSTNVSSVTVEVFNVSWQGWLEQTITFSNKPAAETTVLASTIVTEASGQYYEWDLTEHIINLRNQGVLYVSLLVKNLTNTGNSLINFNSKENTVNKPELKVEYNSLITQARGTKIVNGIVKGVDESAEAGFFTIYPNPVKNGFTIKYSPEFRNRKLRIVDESGKQLKEILLTGTGSQNIRVATLKEGLYFIYIEVNNKRYSQKMLIRN